MKKVQNQTLRSLGFTVAAFLVALVIGGIFLLCIGQNPFSAYYVIFAKAFSSFDQVLRRATPLMLSGLAVAIPLKTGMVNLGGEGQLAIGALAAALVGAYVPLPPVIHPIVCILAGMVVGALAGWIPAFLKARFKAEEVVTTLMFNYVVSYSLAYLCMYPLRASDNMPQTQRILESAYIAQPISGEQWSWGLLVAITVCILAQVFMERTRTGLMIKTAGLSPLTAKFQGVDTRVLAIIGMMAGGALAGLGGSLEILGGKHCYLDQYFASYGFDGISICYMAKNNPVAIIVTAIIMSMLRIGSSTLDRQTGISIYFTVALQGIIIIFLVSPRIIVLVKNLIGKYAARKSAEKEAAK